MADETVEGMWKRMAGRIRDGAGHFRCRQNCSYLGEATSSSAHVTSWIKVNPSPLRVLARLLCKQFVFQPVRVTSSRHHRPTNKALAHSLEAARSHKSVAKS